MKKKDMWEHLRPETWRTTLPGLSEGKEEVDRRVHEDGPGAFSHLKEIIDDDEAQDEVRYRAMGWLVSLYGHPDVDGDAVVEVLKNVVRSTLERAGSQPRRDALTALAHLHENAWEDAPEARDYLLQLAANTGLSRDVTDDVLSALAQTRSPEATRPLALGILEVKDRGLRGKLALGMEENRSVEWTDKATAFIELIIEKHSVRSTDVDARAVVRALSSSWGEDPARRLTEIGNFIIEQSRNRDERVAGVLAKLLIESEGGDQIQAGHRINEYQKDHEIPAGELEGLRATVGGAPALSGIMGVLQKDLEKYFQIPIHELNENTRVSWDKTIKSARGGLVMRLWMSGIVFAVGIVLLLVSSVRMLFGGSSNGVDPSTLVLFLSGLGTMLLIIYTGPLKEIRQAVTDLATASAAFIAYVHRVLETSHTFSFYYLHGNISFERMEQSSAIIREAMINTINALDREARDSSERTITQALKPINEALKRLTKP